VRSGAHVDPLTRHSPALRSTGRINKFSKVFSRKPVKQPIVKSKQPVVTCFYCMKKGHSVRFCKIRKFSVPRAFMKWIPRGCEVSNEKKKSIGLTFVKGPNLVA